MAGNTYTASRLKSNQTFTITAIVNSTDGSTTAEAGGVVAVVSAHALIPKSNTQYTPQVGDRITAGGSTFMLVSVISSSDDAAYSCDLIQVQK